MGRVFKNVMATVYLQVKGDKVMIGALNSKGKTIFEEVLTDNEKIEPEKVQQEIEKIKAVLN